jgi:hypothetical protein
LSDHHMSRKIAIAGVLLIAVVIWLAQRRPAHSNTGEPGNSTEIQEADDFSGRKMSRPLVAANSPNTPAAPPLTTAARLAKAFEGEDADFRLTPAEIADYLAKNQTNALSLITAFQASRDKEFLRKAAAEFPNDPLVQAKVLMHDLFPEQRQQWIDAFKKSSPGNSLPYIFAAQELMAQGNPAGAVAEINSAAGKRFNDYTRESMTGLEEAYLEAGRPPAEAKALGSFEILLPHLAPMKKLAMNFADLAGQYRDAGDTASQQALLSGAWKMGEQLREHGDQSVLLDSLVGLAMQNIALKAWPEGAPADFLSIPVTEQLAANQQYRQDVRKNSSIVDQWLPNAPDHELIAYLDRSRLYGEQNAMEWLKTRHPEIVPATPKP